MHIVELNILIVIFNNVKKMILTLKVFGILEKHNCNMKKILLILAIIVLCVLGYYAFYLGWALLKIFIGLLFIAVFGFGFFLERITKK